MTYKNTLPKQSLGKRCPAVAMFFVSLLMWVAGVLCSAECRFCVPDDLFLRLLSLISCATVALFLNGLYMFEGRAWHLSSLFFFMSSALLFLHADWVATLSLVAVTVSVALLFAVRPESVGRQRALFGAFAFLSFSSLFLLQIIILLPLFFLYLVIGRIGGVRDFFAALLGVVTPYWLLFGTIYSFPYLDFLLVPLKMSFATFVEPSSPVVPLVGVFAFSIEAVVWVVALVVFFVSSSPAKPVLRRRLVFVFSATVFLLLLAIVMPCCFALFMLWSLPGTAVLVSYVLSLKTGRLSIFYFFFLIIAWLAIAVLSLWIG